MPTKESEAENIVSPEPPAFWEHCCQSNNSLFNSPAWHGVLSTGFGARTLYLWHAATQSAATVSVFRAGPFRIGYLGFPTGSIIGDLAPIHGLIKTLPLSLPSLPIHILRWPCSASRPMPSLSYRHEILPETLLINLQDWSDANLLKRVRRDVSKARRSQLVVIEADEPERHGEYMHKLYVQTVMRHHGETRYSASYFRELVRLAAHDQLLRCFLAIHNEKIAAFLVLAIEGDTAYYLHGANDPDLTALCPTDLLIHHAINEAKRLGLSCFNMMASPKNQPSLVRYKEKWGGITQPQTTFDIPLKPTYAKLFYAAYACYKLFRRK